METNNNMLVVWIVIFGVLLILGVGTSAYLLSAPSAPVVVTNGSGLVQEATNPHSDASGAAHSWKTTHYANLFYEFEYPDIFNVKSEQVEAEHKNDADGKDTFGITKVTLEGTKEARDGGYVIEITSRPNYSGALPLELTTLKKTNFFQSTDHGANDNFQMITIDNNDAYKEYRDGSILIGLPTKTLVHELRITWIPTLGSVDAANEYISALTDSYNFK